jgi:hypothetical protein
MRRIGVDSHCGVERQESGMKLDGRVCCRQRRMRGLKCNERQDFVQEANENEDQLTF